MDFKLDCDSFRARSNVANSCNLRSDRTRQNKTGNGDGVSGSDVLQGETCKAPPLCSLASSCSIRSPLLIAITPSPKCNFLCVCHHALRHHHAIVSYIYFLSSSTWFLIPHSNPLLPSLLLTHLLSDLYTAGKLHFFQITPQLKTPLVFLTACRIQALQIAKKNEPSLCV